MQAVPKCYAPASDQRDMPLSSQETRKELQIVIDANALALHKKVDLLVRFLPFGTQLIARELSDGFIFI